MTGPIELRALDLTADPRALIELKNHRAPSHRQWDDDGLRRELADVGRAKGANVVVAWRDSRPVGVAGWVALGVADGEFYGAPVIAHEPVVAEALIERIEAEARAAGAAWLRLSSWPEETTKARAAAGRGYRNVFEFVELAGEPARLAPAPESGALVGLELVPYDAVDPAAFVDIFNDCFREVPNAPSLTLELAVESLRQDAVFAEACQFWRDDGGVYQAFSITMASGYIDTFGVRAEYQRRGIARAMLARTITAARRAGLERLTSTVASTNLPSLELHRRFDFTEVERCRVWQLELV